VTITEGCLFMFISSPRSPNTKTRVVKVAKYAALH
jgi:hypothetical protein